MVKDRFRKEIGAKEHRNQQWADFNWKLMVKRVKNLRQRIFRATQKRNWNLVRSLMKLMLRSQSNLLLSIRRVTQINQGRQTAGIDSHKVLTNPERVKLYLQMKENTPWKAKPTKRVYIPKANGKKRPLGIPVIKDRVLQAVVKNALEPSWEARFERLLHTYVHLLTIAIMYQTNPPPNPKDVLPTMYDLPSEDPEELGLPDEFHEFQPQLLRETCQVPNYFPKSLFIGTDLNLCYDPRHPLWHKRPDWFLVLGVAPAQQQSDLRLSYVAWQEGVNPFLVIELLSPGTEAEDLGQTLREINQPPTKWQVYEQILRIPYYVVFDRYQNQLRGFRLVATRYEELGIPDGRLWFEEIQLGLGVWQGSYQGIEGLWLRWYGRAGNWIAIADERIEQERQRAETERQRAERFAERLRALGIDPDQINPVFIGYLL